MEPISRIFGRLPTNIQSPKTYNPQADPDFVGPTPDEKRRDWLLNYAGVTDLENTFENMRAPQGFKETLEAFKTMVAGQSSWYMLLVFGGHGNGKTKCCEAAVIALYDKRIWVKREKWSDIIRFTLKAAFNNKQPEAITYEQAFGRLRSKPYLIIDDVGMGSTGGKWEWGELEDIVDYRLEHKLFTIITTNLDIKELPPRLVSRFRDMSRCRLVHNKAPDQRPLEGK